MNAISKTILAVSIAFSGAFAHATSSTSFSTSITQPTAEQCVKIRADLDAYIVYVKAWLASQPARKRAFLKPYVDYAIAEAKKLVNKLCPAAPVNPTPYSCSITVSGQPFTAGLTAAGLLTHTGAEKKVCSSASACSSIISQAFVVVGPVLDADCNVGSAAGQSLTDAEVQTKVNQYLGL